MDISIFASQKLASLFGQLRLAPHWPSRDIETETPRSPPPPRPRRAAPPHRRRPPVDGHSSRESNVCPSTSLNASEQNSAPRARCSEPRRTIARRRRRTALCPAVRAPRASHLAERARGATDRPIISSRGGGAMECGVAAAAGGFGPRAGAAQPHAALSPTERSPAKAGLHVNFSDKGEVKERREKFLTAKYGSHQMALIRKRLAVEMWLYDELQKLYETPVSDNLRAAAGAREGAAAAAGAGGGGASQEVEVDIDELLDMDSDEIRRRHLTTLLADAKKPQKEVHKFINELLEKAKTL
ncbi:unnamed protein product, partial [Iphiclides podalirius]